MSSRTQTASVAAPSAAHDEPSDLPDAAEVAALLTRIVRAEHAACSRSGRTTKSDGSWVTDLDRRTQARLFDALCQKWPRYGLVGEEMSHAEQRAQIAACARGDNDGYWVLDPLDGTTNFTAALPFYGISLALVVGGVARIGVVFDPVRDECFRAQLGRGAYLNQRRLRASAIATLGECIAVVDYKRLVGDLSAQLVRSPPYRSHRHLGASALEWCWLAAGRFHLYLHGGQKLWDFAAGCLILNEAGGASTSLSGQPLDCAKLRKRSVVAAASPDLLLRWDNWINANCAAPRSSPL